jgi:hypothetical protein
MIDVRCCVLSRDWNFVPFSKKNSQHDDFLSLSVQFILNHLPVASDVCECWTPVPDKKIASFTNRAYRYILDQLLLKNGKFKGGGYRETHCANLGLCDPSAFGFMCP